MCGRYTVFTEEEIIEMQAIIAEVSRRFGDNAANAFKTGEIFPTDLAPVLGMEGDRIVPRLSKWGFPKWDNKGVIINATVENIMRAFAEPNRRSMFREPMLNRRCVVPSTGFYEWAHVEGKKKKDKYLLRLPGDDMLYMAGITNIFKDAEGNAYETYCILTTAASSSVSRIHDRMPVILAPDEREKWLTDDSFMKRVLTRGGPELELSLPA